MRSILRRLLGLLLKILRLFLVPLRVSLAYPCLRFPRGSQDGWRFCTIKGAVVNTIPLCMEIRTEDTVSQYAVNPREHSEVRKGNGDSAVSMQALGGSGHLPLATRFSPLLTRPGTKALCINKHCN